MPALLAYADYLARTSRLDAARDLYLKVLMLRSDYAAVRIKLADIYQRQGKPELALDELRRVPAESPRNPTLLEGIGDLEAQLGKMQLAVESWRSAESLTTNSASRKRISAKLKAAGGLSNVARELVEQTGAQSCLSKTEPAGYLRLKARGKVSRCLNRHRLRARGC